MKGVLRSLVDLLLPSVCVVCKLGATAFCRACRDGVAPVDSAALAGIEIAAAGAYDGALRSAVLAFKRGRRDVGLALADLVAERWSPSTDAVLVPVPTAAARRAQRGFDQAVLLARELGRHSGLPVLSILERVGDDSQNGRRRSRRLEATGRFAIAGGGDRLLAGARAIVVDDVVTTGTTLRDAVGTLERAGLRARSGVVIARAFPTARATESDREASLPRSAASSRV